MCSYRHIYKVIFYALNAIAGSNIDLPIYIFTQIYFLFAFFFRSYKLEHVRYLLLKIEMQYLLSGPSESNENDSLGSYIYTQSVHRIIIK